MVDMKTKNKSYMRNEHVVRLSNLVLVGLNLADYVVL